MKKYEKDPAKRKAQAIKIMNILELDPEVIKAYEERDEITHAIIKPLTDVNTQKAENILIIERPADDQLIKKVKELEKAFNFTCFYIMQNTTEFGIIENLLIIGQYIEEWQEDEDQALYREPNGQKELFSYVLNTRNPELSDFGYIGVRMLDNYLFRNY